MRIAVTTVLVFAVLAAGGCSLWEGESLEEHAAKSVNEAGWEGKFSCRQVGAELEDGSRLFECVGELVTCTVPMGGEPENTVYFEDVICQ